MNIQFSTRICPEAECIFLLERRFRPGLDIQHNVDEVCHYLSEKIRHPTFRAGAPAAAPLAEVETYVNSNLAVQEDRLRFFFTARNGALNSLAWSLYNAMKRGSQYGAQTPQSVNLILCRFLDVPDDSLDHVTCTDELIQFLMKNGCTEDVKWVCTALYYSMDEYLEELDVILRKATGLFLEHLPDVTALCRQTAAYAETQIGDDPSRIFHNLNITTQSEVITVYPCLMGFHGLSWDFSDSHIYFGVYYELLTNLIQKYSDQSSSLVSRLKSIGDKSRLEILRSLKSGECNGQDISEKLGLAPATISHHMNLLTNEGFVTTTKRGTSTYYTLNSPPSAASFRNWTIASCDIPRPHRPLPHPALPRTPHPIKRRIRAPIGPQIRLFFAIHHSYKTVQSRPFPTHPIRTTPIKSAQPNDFPVGADPCVRPAETSPILIPVGRIRTISKHIPLLPTWNKFKLPTTGGHIVYRLV